MSRSTLMKIVVVITLLIAICASNLVVAQMHSGLSRGSLVLTGGDLGKGVIERFVELAGGPDANFVYIPTAASSLRLPSGFIYDPPDSDVPGNNTQAFEEELAKMFGVKNVTVLHTRNRKTANSETFVAPLKRANGVWLSSGNAGRLANAYLDTLTQKEIAAVPGRGGIVGGNSAGAIIQGSYTVRGRPDKPLLMAKGHERGFGFLKDVAINPHLTEAKRDTELVNATLPGADIREEFAGVADVSIALLSFS